MEEQYLTSYDDVVQVLENITDRVRQIIVEENLNHDTSTDMPKTAKDVLIIINKVLYKELGLQKYILHKNSVNFATVVFCIEKVKPICDILHCQAIYYTSKFTRFWRWEWEYHLP